MLKFSARNDREPTLSDVYERLGLADPEGFLHDVCHILREVYRTNRDRHDEELGDDMTTFGIQIYRNSWYKLEMELPVLHSEVEASRPKGSLEIRTPMKCLKIYRGGSDKQSWIEEYDPANGSVTKQQIVELNELEINQLDLFEQHNTDGAIDIGPHLT